MRSHLWAIGFSFTTMSCDSERTRYTNNKNTDNLLKIENRKNERWHKRMKNCKVNKNSIQNNNGHSEYVFWNDIQ